MKLSARQDIVAPITAVSEALTDFGAFERAILRRGGEVTRTDPGATPAIGSRWHCRISYRGRSHEIDSELTALEPCRRVALHSHSGGVSATLTVDLTALAPGRTRAGIDLELHPRTVPGRFFLQSLRLARRRLDARFRDAIARYARRIEERAAARPLRDGADRPDRRRVSSPPT